MVDLFQYNWQVRDEWFAWCETLPEVELVKTRAGGMGSILRNLYHVIDCEQLWVNQMLGNNVIPSDIASVNSLDNVMEFSKLTRPITEGFISNWKPEDESKLLEITSKSGKEHSFTYGKIIQHLITHEVHHIGQLSIWSREIGIKPVSSDLIIRNY